MTEQGSRSSFHGVRSSPSSSRHVTYPSYQTSSTSHSDFRSIPGVINNGDKKQLLHPHVLPMTKSNSLEDRLRNILTVNGNGREKGISNYAFEPQDGDLIAPPRPPYPRLADLDSEKSYQRNSLTSPAATSGYMPSFLSKSEAHHDGNRLNPRLPPRSIPITSNPPQYQPPPHYTNANINVKIQQEPKVPLNNNFFQSGSNIQIPEKLQQTRMENYSLQKDAYSKNSNSPMKEESKVVKNLSPYTLSPYKSHPRSLHNVAKPNPQTAHDPHLVQNAHNPQSVHSTHNLWSNKRLSNSNNELQQNSHKSLYSSSQVSGNHRKSNSIHTDQTVYGNPLINTQVTNNRLNNQADEQSSPNKNYPQDYTEMNTFKFMNRNPSSASYCNVHDRHFKQENLSRTVSSQMMDIPAANRLSLASSLSITPPLPSLSPSNTPPITPPPDSPDHKQLVQDKTTSLPSSSSYLGWTPDVISHATKPYTATQSTTPDYINKNKLSTVASNHTFNGNFRELSESEETEEEDEEEKKKPDERWNIVQQQIGQLESMYVNIVETMKTNLERSPPSRASFSSTTSTSYAGKLHRSHTRGRHRSKDIKQINKRFARLESHVVTLARSVAHLSSEMRNLSGVAQQMDSIQMELARVKDINFRKPQHRKTAGTLHSGTNMKQWVPSLTHPKRVNKLSWFFGQEPPLLDMFLKELGYERYTPNFDTEKIGMIELPYLNEERLAKIGIPMGPRLRILQEAQLCFKKDNFDIYIV